LQDAVMRARENAFYDDMVALGEDVLRLDPGIRKRADEILVVLLDRLWSLELDVSRRCHFAIGRSLARDGFHVMRVERLLPSLDHSPRLELRRGGDLVELARRLRVSGLVLRKRCDQLLRLRPER